MLFNSFHFAVFFPLVIFLYFALRPKYRWILLLAASYYFYMSWKVEYALLLVLSTVIDYYCGIQIEKAISKKVKKRFLYLSLLVNLGVLFTFKYLFFFGHSGWMIFESFNAGFSQYNIFGDSFLAYNILLPVGISFYTFQTLSYTIDVYRGNTKAERHLGYFFVFVSFFPQLVAGPIERYNHLMPQLKSDFTFDYQRVVTGLKIMAIGFFKKLVIADRIAIIVDDIYRNPASYSGLETFGGILLFYIQLFADFSGYTDIAIGAALVMGYRLSRNFNQPYFSKNIIDFWKKWHITLTTWFRDYFYYWLKRKVNLEKNIAILLMFTGVGLWHGANWTFVIWGFLMGLFLVIDQMTIKSRMRIFDMTGIIRLPVLYKILTIGTTITLLALSGIFLRSSSVADALLIFEKIFAFNEGYFRFNFYGINQYSFILILIILVIVWLIKALQDFKRLDKIFTGKVASFKTPVRWAAYVILLYIILNFGVFAKNAFIYYQF